MAKLNDSVMIVLPSLTLQLKILCNVTIPQGNVTIPLGNVTIPLGNVTIPLCNVTIPLGKYGEATGQI